MRVCAIADDLTGALETGVHLVRSPNGAAVITNVATASLLASSFVVDAETRHLSPGDAYERVRAIAEVLASCRANFLFKKTDSTLRGQIGAEFRALLEVFSNHSLLFVPAYPSMGRVVQHGILHVNQIPVGLTEFSLDLLNPVTESNIVQLLAPGFPIPILSITPHDLVPTTQQVVWIVDCETEEDVLLTAKFAIQAENIIAAGSAFFVGCIATELNWTASQHPSAPMRCLVINGSRHSQSRFQVEHATREGWSHFNISNAARRFDSPGWCLLDTDDLGLSGIERARHLGELVRDVVTTTLVDALCVFGGDTAFGIMDALGQPVLWPLRELFPGIPESRFEWGHRDMRLITKAGGFGPIDILPRIYDRYWSDAKCC